MKTQLTNLFNQLDKTATENFTTEGKENLETGLNSHAKIFSAAELWNIQRQHRTVTGRRRFN